jgi:type IV pilus assembly protein PilM
MNLLPKASENRPRVACEITSQGVVAGRSADSASPLSAVARVPLAAGAVVPGLRPGNVVDRVAVIAALRKALEEIEAKPNSRNADITLVIPDAAARVLLLDFDALTTKQTEALPIVRFRLKKLLPFDADEAMVSYQIMSTSRGLVRVLALAMPRDVLSEYETAAREAGFEPGTVLPSTLAASAALEGDGPSLLVNANSVGVTTAIVQQGILLLHRSVDLQEHNSNAYASSAPIAIAEPTSLSTAVVHDEPPPPDMQSVPLYTEIAQAVSVAAAYFEDTLASAPQQVFSAGPLGAEKLGRILRDSGVGSEDGLFVRELVESSALLSDAVKTSVPRALLSSVAGALRA